MARAEVGLDRGTPGIADDDDGGGGGGIGVGDIWSRGRGGENVVMKGGGGFRASRKVGGMCGSC